MFLSSNTSKRGFTILELSIVLVIIGLLAAGILVGRDLIQAATIRRQIAQIEKINTAVMTFREKYGGIPGDLQSAIASGAGFTMRSGGRGHGDGNGFVQDCDYDPLSGNTELGCEVVLFWSDLSAANMIEGSFTTAADAVPLFSTYEESLKLYPVSKLSDRITLIPAFERRESKNWLATAHISSTDGVLTTYTRYLIHTTIAMSIDAKMDDQLPLTGRVQARDSYTNTDYGFFSALSPEGQFGCVEAGVYNYDHPNSYPPCQINFQMMY